MIHKYFSVIKHILCGALVLASFQSNAQAFSWIREAGDNNRFSWAQSVSIDHHHNEVISGFQNDSTHFGSTILPFFGNFDGYLAKYDSSGNLLWVNDIGGTDADKAYHTVIDDSDNIYIVGGFMSNNLRLSATDSIPLTSAGNENFFLAKYDKNGNFLWARNGGKASPASYACRAKAVAIDPSTGNVVIGGYYSASMLIAGTTTTLAGTSGTVGLFVIEYTPDGTFVWANNVLSLANCAINAIACDGTGNVFVTGKNDYFMYTPTDTINTHSGDHMFLSKYNASGALQWVDTLGKALQTGATDNSITSGNDLVLDNSGNVYVAGNWLDTVYLAYDTALSTWRPVYKQYGFIAKYTNSGAQTWMQSFGGDNILYQGSISESDQVNGIAMDAAGDLYATGDFVANTTFGGLAMTVPSIGTGFIGKFAPATGNAIWIKTGGGLNGNQSLDIAVDQNGGGIATTGTFQNLVTFDTVTVSSTSTALTYQDVYLTRQINPVSGPLSVTPATISMPYRIYPNPASGYINIDLPDGVYHKIFITTITGQTLISTQTNNSSLQLNIQTLTPGNYTISIIDDHNTMISGKLVKI